MRNILFAALVLLVAVSCGKKPAEFTGKITGLKPNSQVSIMNIADSRNLIPVTVDAEGNYSFEINEGPCARYLIVDDPKGGYKFYAEPGMKANIDLEFRRIDDPSGEEVYQFVTTYTGDNKDAFDFLTEGEYFQTVQNPVIMEHYGKHDLTFDEMRRMFNEAKDEQVVKLQKIENPTFRKWMEEDYNEKLKGSLGWYPELGVKDDPSYKAYLESLDRNGNLTDASAFMDGYSFTTLPDGPEKNVAWFKALNELFTNKEIIRQLADGRIAQVLQRAPSNIEDVFAAYQAVDPSYAVPAEIQEVYDHYKGMVPGAFAADFDMYDLEGNKVMLSDLRGKALYIDCWATWCGPCRAEAPNMVKLYQHFKKDPRISLVSISLDKKEAQWKAVVEKEGQAWPQYIVHDEFESALCKNYDITGIPRFLFFDKEGRIISLNAKRPSADDIVDWIESQLK